MARACYEKGMGAGPTVARFVARMRRNSVGKRRFRRAVGIAMAISDNRWACAMLLAHVPVSCYMWAKAQPRSRRGGSLRVIGIDPGLRSMGWGVISITGSRISHVANGQCLGAGEVMADRLLALHVGLSAIIAEHMPDAAAVEQVFVNSNGAGTLKLGQARGIALLVPAQAGLTVGEYAPNTIKKCVVGVGHAAKEQVQHMVRLQLPGVDLTGPDAADALAIAICHAHHLGSAAAMARAVKVRA